MLGSVTLKQSVLDQREISLRDQSLGSIWLDLTHLSRQDNARLWAGSGTSVRKCPSFINGYEFEHSTVYAKLLNRNTTAHLMPQKLCCETSNLFKFQCKMCNFGGL